LFIDESGKHLCPPDVPYRVYLRTGNETVMVFSRHLAAAGKVLQVAGNQEIDEIPGLHGPILIL